MVATTRKMVLGAVLAGLLAVQAAPARDLGLDTELAEEPAGGLGRELDFEGTDRERLEELREWLRQRELARKQNRPFQVESLGDLDELRFNDPYRGGGRLYNAESLEPPGTRVLRIGRGADGRLRHQYVLYPSGQSEAEPADPDGLASGGGGADPEPEAAAGTGRRHYAGHHRSRHKAVRHRRSSHHSGHHRRRR
jgi:hypothetical protein